MTAVDPVGAAPATTPLAQRPWVAGSRADGASELSGQVFAVAVGFVVAWRTRSVLLSLGAGLAAYALLGVLA